MEDGKKLEDKEQLSGQKNQNQEQNCINDYILNSKDTLCPLCKFDVLTILNDSNYNEIDKKHNYNKKVDTNGYCKRIKRFCDHCDRKG